MGVESDADLVQAAGSGDERASGELYRRHHSAVLGYARGLVRDQHMAEDLTSEAFTRTFAALQQGAGPREACRPYLYTVVRNAAVDWARAARRTVVTDEVAEWADGPADEMPDVDELDALVRAFRSLPERWQTVLWHTIIEDEPVQKVSEVLGMEPGAVTQLAFRAREGLRQAFLAASVEGRPECAEYIAQLAAGVRRPGRRRSRALRQHLETCAHCRRAAEEMSDLNARLRRSLPLGAIILGAPSAPLSALVPAGAGVPAWAFPAGVAGAAAAVLAILYAATGMGPSERPPPQAAPPKQAAPPATLPATKVPEPARSTAPRVAVPNDIRPSASPQAGGGATAQNAPGVYRIRNVTLQSCLVPDGPSVVATQGTCGGTASTWRRTDTAGGFTLTNAATGTCMARGASSAGAPWESPTQYAVTMARCGGADQVWKLVQSTGVTKLSNGDGWFLQASWSGLQPVTLKSSSFAGMAAQGWSLDKP
ncbi:sigma-70 family RNA polymerase sigma factor [Spirillospora sp. NPDC047279]|uniref:sigma-70 family RNA polymerase sigma factor n=1 Tax=Spirillospora sp. NPDC047279 TaxID=3155478 RepID=UPI0033F796F3